MNIVVLNDFAHINGGAAQVALNSAVGLAAKGHRVIVLSSVGPVMQELGANGVEVVLTNQHEIANDPDWVRAAIQGIWNKTAREAVRQLLRRFDPAGTVVHVHGWSKALSSSVVRECARRGFRILCTLHDYFSVCPNGGLFDFPKGEICTLDPMSLRCIVRNCDARNYAQKQWRVLRQVVQGSVGGIPGAIDTFIAVSDFSRRVLEPHLPARSRIVLLQNPIDVNEQPRASISADSPFVFIGRFSPEKGAGLLAAAGRGLDCPVVFVGEGQCQAEIEGRLPSAILTGWLPRSEAHAWLKRSRALVLPSIWYETQGMVVAEAAAFGIPAIVPDTSAARDMVINGRTGLWFDGGSEASLREAMQALLDVGLANQMGKAAYEHYWQNPATLEKHVEKLEDCYRSVLEP